MNRIASIDIGTNTLLLLICEFDNNDSMKVIKDYHRIARLGEGLNESGFISDTALSRAKEILSDYKAELDNNSVSHCKIVATSAMRDAQNSDYIKSELESIIGFSIEIIEGVEEARYSYIGSNEEIENAVVLDIGGGSTELIYGDGSKISSRTSLDIGAVRLTEMFNLTMKKAEDIQKAKNYLKQELLSLNKNDNNTLIAVAGTPTSLTQMHLKLKEFVPEQIHNIIVNKSELEVLQNIIINKSKQDLITEYGIHPNRADVLIGGSLILSAYLEELGFDSYTTSIKGLRYGVIVDYYKEKKYKL